MNSISRKRQAAAQDFLDKLATRVGKTGAAVVTLRQDRKAILTESDLAKLAEKHGFHILRKGDVYTLAARRRPAAC